jgi:hypothetical protein
VDPSDSDKFKKYSKFQADWIRYLEKCLENDLISVENREAIRAVIIENKKMLLEED